MWRCAVVHISMLAIEAFAAECLHVYRHSIAYPHTFNVGTYFFYYSHHLVTNGNARHSPWHTTMLDMQVAGTDTAQRNADYSVGTFQKLRLRFLYQGKLTFFYICICFHLFIVISFIYI